MAVQGRFMGISRGTCVICDEEHDLIPICIDCVEDKVTMVVEKGCNVPLKAISLEKGGVPPNAIKNALKRLKEEYGYGIKDVYQESGEEQESL